MTPLVLLLGSLGFSLAFNIVWAWGTHPLSVLAAAACTLVVPAGLHLWPQIPAGTRWRRFWRGLVMLGICVAAAVTSFAHAVSVLVAAGWTDWTAWSVTGGVELLVALSTMALNGPRSGPVQVTNSAPDRGVDRGVDTPADTPDSATTDTADSSAAAPVQADRPVRRPARPRANTLTVADPDRSADLRAWVSELGHRPSEYAVRTRYGCRQSVAQRLLEDLDRDTDDDPARDPAEVAS